VSQSESSMGVDHFRGFPQNRQRNNRRVCNTGIDHELLPNLCLLIIRDVPVISLYRYINSCVKIPLNYLKINNSE
jgi:hypothetical protein